MKKLIPFALAVVMMLSIVGCGNKAPAASPAASSTNTPVSTPTNKVNAIKDLPGKTIGVQQSTTGDIYASDYEKQGSKIERYSKGNDAVLALVQNKIDCVIIDEQPAKAFVAANNGKLKILAEPFANEDYAICVSKTNAKLTTAINGALADLKKDGTLQKIVDGYISGTGFKYASPANVDRSKGQLIMATNAYFPPYEFYDNQKVVGIDADIAQAICDKLGYSLKIEDMEFDSIITAVQTGKVSFGMAGMTVTEDRKKNIDFTDSYASSKQVIIVRSN